MRTDELAAVDTTIIGHLFVLFAWVRSVRMRPDIVLSIAPRDLNIVVERQLDQMRWYQRQ